MQYEQLAGGGARIDLPRPSIDTGMGLERMAAVLQGTHDNYKIDLFGALIEAVADLTNVDAERARQRPRMRVIADHLRASVVPHRRRGAAVERGPPGGYHVRRIMRAAPCATPSSSAPEDPLMWRLTCSLLVREMGQGLSGAAVAPSPA